MKRITSILALLTSCCLAQQDPSGDGRGSGNQAELDPFADTGSYIPPPNIRVFLQYIEVAHTDLTTMMADAPSGAALHGKAMALVEKREARIVDSAVLTFQFGRRAFVESHLELIFVEGFSGDELPNRIPEMAPSDRASRRIPWWIWSSKNAREQPMQEWWTANVGIFHELEANIADGTRSVFLWGAAYDSTLAGMSVIKAHRIAQGDDSIRMPQFQKRRASLGLTLNPDVWQLAAVLDPLPRPPAPAQSTKVLLFVRCEVPGESGN